MPIPRGMPERRSASTPGRIAAAIVKAKKSSARTSLSFQSASAITTTPRTTTVARKARRAVSLTRTSYPRASRRKTPAPRPLCRGLIFGEDPARNTRPTVEGSFTKCAWRRGHERREAARGGARGGGGRRGTVAEGEPRGEPRCGSDLRRHDAGGPVPRAEPAGCRRRRRRAGAHPEERRGDAGDSAGKGEGEAADEGGDGEEGEEGEEVGPADRRRPRAAALTASPRRLDTPGSAVVFREA